MYLEKLLEKIEYVLLQGDVHREITDLVYDSRKVTPNCVFVCVQGAVTDGHDYIQTVVEMGATVLVVEREVNVPSNITVIQLNNSREGLAFMAAAYFDYPASKLKTIGITGTKGKTTTTYMVKSMLENSGLKVGLIGTIETIIGDHVIPADNTTPESYVVQESFAQMVEAACDCVVMEASSQGLMQHRLDGFIFDYGVFTNIEPDHIGGNEHKDFEDYMSSKQKLFRQCKVGLFNQDDSHYETFVQGSTCQVITFGFESEADYHGKDLQLLKRDDYFGVAYQITGLIDMGVEIPIPGKFNGYNSLCAIAISHHLGTTMERMQQALGKIKVRGRVEPVPVCDQFVIMIDYAHNAMSLNSLLTTLREYKPNRLICMFGCGGNRSRSRRFEMGEVSSYLADLTIITTDNPRNEEPQDIIDDIIVGVKKGPGIYVEISDRKEAIRYAIEHGETGDLIIIAGKGHENYQEIKGVKYHMDDREMIEEIVTELGICS